MEKAYEIFKKYIDADKYENLINELKENNVYFAGQENLDIRYGKLKSDMDEKSKLYEEAQKHIENLNQGVKTSEELKLKQQEYEQKIKALEAENQQIKIDSILKQALTKEKGEDIEYLTYKIKNEYSKNNTPFEIDQDGNLKGLNDVLDAVKKKHSKLFQPQVISKEAIVQKVGKSDEETTAEPKSLIEALKAKYEQQKT